MRLALLLVSAVILAPVLVQAAPAKAKCTASEIARTSSALGLVGAQGPQGPAGPTGIQGTPASSGIALASCHIRTSEITASSLGLATVAPVSIELRTITGSNADKVAGVTYTFDDPENQSYRAKVQPWCCARPR